MTSESSLTEQLEKLAESKHVFSEKLLYSVAGDLIIASSTPVVAQYTKTYGYIARVADIQDAGPAVRIHDWLFALERAPDPSLEVEMGKQPQFMSKDSSGHSFRLVGVHGDDLYRFEYNVAGGPGLAIRLLDAVLLHLNNAFQFVVNPDSGKVRVVFSPCVEHTICGVPIVLTNFLGSECV